MADDFQEEQLKADTARRLREHLPGARVCYVESDRGVTYLITMSQDRADDVIATLDVLSEQSEQ